LKFPQQFTFEAQGQVTSNTRQLCISGPSKDLHPTRFHAFSQDETNAIEQRPNPHK